MNFDQKQILRARMRDQARSAGLDQRAIDSAQVAARVAAVIGEIRPVTALGFIPLPSEPVWLEHPELDPLKFAFPRVTAGGVEFFRLSAWESLVVGPVGTKEPAPIPELAVEIGEADLILVPGVAFDRTGRRLGRGRGYYDQILSKAAPQCLIVGIAFDWQIVDEVPVEAHDHAVDLMITPQEVFSPQPR